MNIAGRSVLVTGANGFIGSHLAAALLDAGAEVRAMCLYNEQGSVGWLDELDASRRAALDVRLGDVRDAGFVDDSVAGCEIVMHLAALVSIPYSYLAPRSFVDTNVGGTLNVLEAARRHGTQRVVHTSTSEVYGSPETTPIREDHPLRGQSPYSASKIAADKLCEAYARSFELPVVVLRPFNTYGPRQSARAVIPVILGQLLAGAREVHLGSLSPRRDFTYVTDTVAGFVAMATAELEPGAVIQLGTGRSVSIGELFEQCLAVVGTEATPRIDEQRIRPAKSEVDHLESDPTRARELLNWGPEVELEDGLRRTAAWLREHLDVSRTAEYQR